MRCAKVVGVGMALLALTWALGAEARWGTLQMRERRVPGGSHLYVAAKGDTIWYSGFEPGDSLGTNYDYNQGSSPDEWHVTDRMLYEDSPTWITADQGSYFCHIGNDTTGYSDGNDVGYQVYLDLSGYSDVGMYYLSAMQAYENSTFDKFAVWGWTESIPESLYNLDPGEGYAWGGDWGPYWYGPPGDTLITLSMLEGYPDVILEFWFYSVTGNPWGFGVGIDEIVITGTPATSIEGVEEGTGLPQDFALAPPYPNPFNAGTTIRYQVPQAQVQMDIYNVRGQLVRTLVQGQVPAGSHIQTWDGRDTRGAEVESGLYFCRLQSDHVSLTRKLVLLR
jgi:hypothetical protein